VTFEEHMSGIVRDAIHQVLDERDEHALPELYTLQQASDRYHGQIKVSTLRALCKSGVLPYVRLTEGGPYYLTPEGLRAAIQRCSIPPTTRPRIPRAGKDKAL